MISWIKIHLECTYLFTKQLPDKMSTEHHVDVFVYQSTFSLEFVVSFRCPCVELSGDPPCGGTAYSSDLKGGEPTVKGNGMTTQTLDTQVHLSHGFTCDDILQSTVLALAHLRLHLLPLQLGKEVHFGHLGTLKGYQNTERVKVESKKKFEHHMTEPKQTGQPWWSQACFLASMETSVNATV